MSEVTETQLPGVGVRHEFVTAGGERVAVLTHRTGRRELAVYDRADPDACTTVLHLSPTTPAPWPSCSAPVRSAKRWRPSSSGSRAWPSTGSRSRRVRRRHHDRRRGVPDPHRRIDRGRRPGRDHSPPPAPTTTSRPGTWSSPSGHRTGWPSCATCWCPDRARRGRRPEAAKAFIEIGAVALALAFLARLAGRLGITAIPFYLLAGLAVGEGGVAPLDVSAEFISLVAEIGVLLLLLTLGLEYTADELRHGLRTGLVPGVIDAALNFLPGFAAGLLLGWDPTAAVLLGGVCWVSSSGVVGQGPHRPRPPRQPGDAEHPEPAGDRGPGHGGLPARRRSPGRRPGRRRDARPPWPSPSSRWPSSSSVALRLGTH